MSHDNVTSLSLLERVRSSDQEEREAVNELLAG